MINEKIKRKDIEEIQEMSTENLVKILQLFTSYRMTDNLFVECVRYEIENRHRLESRCSVVGNV
jgi:hypothetical protein